MNIISLVNSVEMYLSYRQELYCNPVFVYISSEVTQVTLDVVLKNTP
jgi:hypothetical protein